MYSVLLMVAMTGAADAPAYYPQPVTTGCYGASYGSCYGCYGTTYSSCYGCSGCYGTTYRGCYGCSGCYGTTYSSCYGCSGCYGTTYSSCYGCSGCYGTVVTPTYYSCSGCYGTVVTPTYHSCTGCFGGGCTGVVILNGCCGGHVVVQPAVAVEDKKDQPKKEDKKDQPKKEDKKDQPKIEGKDVEARQGDAPATLVVNLPADAKLTVDGVKTEGSTARRTFSSPPLVQGKEYTYYLSVEVLRDGKSVTLTKEAVVRAGEETLITIQDPAAIAKR